MTGKIKIVYLIDELNVGGTENQLIQTIERLDKKKFEIHLICLRPTDFFLTLNLDCEKRILNVFSLLSVSGIQKFFKFIRYLRNLKIDIIQTYFFDSTLFGVIAGRLAGVNKVITCRRDMGFWYNKKILIILKFLNYFVDGILVNSIAVKENVHIFEAVPYGKIDIMYNGFDLEKFKKASATIKIRQKIGIEKTDTIVGIVANFNRQVKRVDIFLRAAALIHSKVNSTSFVLIGDGGQREALMALAKELKIAHKVFFLGTQENVVPYLSIFDIGMITSESEGLSNSIIEYMAMGIPVVCTNAGGNTELIENGVNGFVFDINNYFECAQKALDILESDKVRKVFGTNNIQKVSEKFDWNGIIRKMEKYYSESL